MAENKIQKILRETGSEAIVTESEDFRRYLTGFGGTDGIFVADKESARLYTDARYFEAAEKALAGTDVQAVLLQSSLQVREVLKAYKSIGVAFCRTNLEQAKEYESLGLELLDAMPALSRSMAVKSKEELENIQKACTAAEAGFLKLLPELKEGMTESEAAALLEYNMRVAGASGTSFDTICAFGAGGSIPHYETGNVKLKFGDVILIDFGCKVNGYCSDITRTFLFGDDGKHEEFKKNYNIVLGAHQKVLDEGHAGMLGREADAIARNYLRDHGGLDKYFTHSLGHGIGLNIHEFPPRLSSGSNDVLAEGMVFSDEPGVYFAGEYGIRIEDSVTIADGKFRSFMKTDKKLMIL